MDMLMCTGKRQLLAIAKGKVNGKKNFWSVPPTVLGKGALAIPQDSLEPFLYQVNDITPRLDLLILSLSIGTLECLSYCW